MSSTQKDFLMHLAIVVISAVLSFCLSYLEKLSSPVTTAAVGGGLANIINGTRLIYKFS